MLLVDGRSRWRSGPGGEVSGSLLGEVVDCVVEQLQIFPVLLDWSRVGRGVGGQVGAGGLEASEPVGGGVAIPGGVNHGGRPVLGELPLELLDALDPPLVGGIELFAANLFSRELVALVDSLVQLVMGSLEVGGQAVDVMGSLVVLMAAAAGQAA